MNKKLEDRRAAIICEHIANQDYPILRARRDEPIDEIDSGWQFVCNSGKPENKDHAQVMKIDALLTGF